MAGRKQSEEEKRLHVEVIKQMVTLSTSGFGLVAALAWNSLIQEVVNSYVKKWLPGNSGIISLLIYALVVTVLAVFVTLQLSRLSQKLQSQSED
ncbi:MAG: hypothetical protein A3H50_01560 [Candidatus Levybacteria bacterium RIFCSPLOWO2_02_FULL_37_10]|nr:MAG: hypothetical protein A2860_03270 [Candidatus Levybacteria bacterium RIFCSPHIGHO2_01_FULL_37_33]OGH17445.1 MAG: hypothetical protein A3C97_03280 [Candidatus Levybacteria bacterium RIFCSPHIGHO2_02_FULL_37_11]OGH29885.1 MAG: hypothetical protein A3F30_01705 [Candidatus Levybacteria bacterium RIFCSPHIGHO2_12_FULL_37_12]OGH32991.1 MAG: hypothetical protein A2953_01065 [Candidatus Levybacteria bacterium RIFCSPLOWO2_01_FULL_36_54]OGH43355.1 MAG: hypothetical protein A3H50_01560 [Candidatus Lev